MNAKERSAVLMTSLYVPNLPEAFENNIKGSMWIGEHQDKPISCIDDDEILWNDRSGCLKGGVYCTSLQYIR